MIKFNKLREYLKRPEYIFATIVGIFGLVAVFMIPPGWNSDEYQHYFRVEQLTDGKLFAVNEDGQRGGVSGGYINRGVVEFISSYGFENEEARDNTLGSSRIWHNQDRRTDRDDRVFVSFNGSAVYPPLTYLPQIVGNATGRALGMPIYGSFLLAKLFGLAFFIGAVFLAIRILPRGKWILLAITLLATTVVQATALGADAVTFSVVVLFISYILYLTSKKEKLNIKQVVIMSVLMASVGLVKPTYVALVPLVGLLLINKRNRKVGVIIQLVAGVTIAMTIALVWLQLTSYVGTNGGPASDRSLQLAHILGSPFEFIATIARTYFGVVPGGYWNKFYEIAFTNFTWDTVRIASGFALLSLIGIITSLGIADSTRLPRRTRLQKSIELFLMAGTFIATFMLINLALYLYFTPVGQNVVVGVQARYIFPFLILLLLPLQNIYKNQRLAKSIMIITLMIPLVVSFVGIYKMIYIL